MITSVWDGCSDNKNVIVIDAHLINSALSEKVQKEIEARALENAANKTVHIKATVNYWIPNTNPITLNDLKKIEKHLSNLGISSDRVLFNFIGSEKKYGGIYFGQPTSLKSLSELIKFLEKNHKSRLNLHLKENEGKNMFNRPEMQTVISGWQKWRNMQEKETQDAQKKANKKAGLNASNVFGKYYRSRV